MICGENRQKTATDGTPEEETWRPGLVTERNYDESRAFEIDLAGMMCLEKAPISIEGHRTSISLEDAFWNGLRILHANAMVSLQSLIGRLMKPGDRWIPPDLPSENLSSAIRVIGVGAIISRESGSTP